MSEPAGTSRRTVLASAGVGAAGLGAAPPPAARGAVSPRGRPGQSVVEFRGRISQSGPSGEAFMSNGFLTAVAGLTLGDLFAGSPPAVGTALFTAHATGELSARVLDQSVHSLDIAGQMSRLPAVLPGADWLDPGSFTSGRLVARYDLTLQDVLAVFAPGKGLPTLTGEMRQTFAGRVGPASSSAGAARSADVRERPRHARRPGHAQRRPRDRGQLVRAVRPGATSPWSASASRPPAGTTVEELWRSLCSARSTAEPYSDERLPATPPSS